MNFQYSYRAFLITCLLFGILFLTLFSIHLGEGTPPFEPEYDIEYAAELPPIPEEETALTELPEQNNPSVETNRAYNEAREYRNETTTLPNEDTSLEELLERMDKAMEEGNGTTTEEGIAAAKEKIAETQDKIQENQSGLPTQGSGANRNTTIKYRLVHRSALSLPNPVYTCEGGGSVVINITVNDRGQVVKTSYNENTSTTNNGCLIDSALEYAQSARFSSKAGKDSQLGTITYNFPGQQ
ncbi:hypothetical protein [Altibacter sp. HG106]|uniref:hypothetical protein n=1 Tax=Altibacter sp. HG106 TaxID=3023937 RepID=UPI00234FDAE3|nr:hypothetical protein [Altibacter sp. HG106]MDC7995243.1 hypothetical protein [Altibacter sp. HG106]